MDTEAAAKPPRSVVSAMREFLQHEAASGILLMIATVVALAMANSFLADVYGKLLSTPVSVRIGDYFDIDKPLLLWINDGLMAVFFFLVGLEIKREVLEGELSDPAQIALPALAALGGMLVPALVYAAFNWGDEAAIRGWAIPAATDIAFALGVLALLGKGVPNGLKVFLLTLAILDDLGAIVIIALFYTANVSVTMLSVAAVSLVVLTVLNRRGVTALPPYVLVGLVMWAAVLKSGVHATLAGVALAFFIPLRVPEGQESPLRKLEHDLHPSVAYGILPVFAFANAGVSLQGFEFSSLMQPLPLGIALGLFVGKQIGVFGFAWAAIKLGLARLPEGANWASLYGVAILCGIGFTMSLFIAALAFEGGGPAAGGLDRLGILSGSLVSAVVGYLLLKRALRGRSAAPPE
jgi:NhaA family Na+:H+ antiporter